MALIDLTYDEIKYIVQQFKSNPNNTQFTMINPGEHMSFNDDAWYYWVFKTYPEMVAWVEINMQEQVENIPEVGMM